MVSRRFISAVLVLPPADYSGCSVSRCSSGGHFSTARLGSQCLDDHDVPLSRLSDSGLGRLPHENCLFRAKQHFN